MLQAMACVAAEGNAGICFAFPQGPSRDLAVEPLVSERSRCSEFLPTWDCRRICGIFISCKYRWNSHRRSDVKRTLGRLFVSRL